MRKIVLILIALCLCSSAYALDTSNLMMYWAFDETSGTLVEDSHYHFYNSTANALLVPASPGKFGYFRNNTGVADPYIVYNTGDIPQVNSTVTFWYYALPVGSTKQLIYNSKDSDAYSIEQRADGGLYCGYHRHAGVTASIGMGNVAYNQWTFFTMIIYKGNYNVSCYHNTFVANLSDFSGGTNNQPRFFGINAHSTGIGIDEWAVFNRTLTHAEVMEIYNGGAGKNYMGLILNANLISQPVNGRAYNTKNQKINFTSVPTNSNLTLFLDTNQNPVTSVATSTGSPLNYITQETSNATYYYKANVKNGNWSYNSSIYSYSFDDYPPNVTLNPTNFFSYTNDTINWADLRFNLSFYDNRKLYSYSINISTSTGVTAWNRTIENINDISINYTEQIILLSQQGVYTVRIMMYDDGLNSQLNSNGMDFKFTFSPLPYNVSISLSDKLVFSNASYLSFYNLSLNTSYLHSILGDCSCAGCSIQGAYCRIPLRINTEYDSTMNLTLHGNYSFGIDNCSNSYGIPSNRSFLNITFQNFLDNSSALTNSSVSLFYGDEYDSNDYSFVFTGKLQNNLSLCIYPQWAALYTVSDVQYIDTLGLFYQANQLHYFPNNYTSFLLPLFVTGAGTTTLFTIKDQDTSKVLTDALCTSYIYTGGVYIGVESKLSDISGKIQFTYLPNYNYKFMCSKTGYNNLIFYLTPIVSSTYDIPMKKTIGLNSTMDYERVAISYSPTAYAEGRSYVFTFVISGLNELMRYGYTIKYPGGSNSSSGSNPAGETLSNGFEINGATVQSMVELNYYYEIPASGLRNFTTYFAINVPQANNTMTGNQDTTYGMTVFERTLVVIFILLLCVGLASLVGQPVMGFVMGLFFMGYFTYIGFVPIWVIALPMVIGVIMLFTRSE